jgi:hypothetical protein
MRKQLLALTLAIGIGLTATAIPAHAEKANDGLNSMSGACASLQSRGASLVDEYKNASEDRRGQILNELRTIGSDWKLTGCQGAYGNIALPAMPTTPGRTARPTDAQVRQR